MKKYNCKNCGAELHWDIEQQKLLCPYCEKTFAAEEFSDTAENDSDSDDLNIARESDEKDIATDNSDETDKLAVYKCENCGAEVVTSVSTIATTCAYCGRNLTISKNDTKEVKKKFSPTKIIPFLFNKDMVQQEYSKHIKKSVLTPKEFATKNIIKKIRGVYIPFWLFDIDMDGNITVKVDESTSVTHGNKVTTTTTTKEVNQSGHAKFNQIPADGLKNFDNELASYIEPFDFEKLVDYNPSYMAGFYSECFNESEEDTSIVAVKKAAEGLKEGFLANVRESGVKSVKTYQHKHHIENVEYAMLPVWLMYTRYKDKDYLYAMNGETGKFTGKVPIDKKKCLLISLTSFFSCFGVSILLGLLNLF